MTVTNYMSALFNVDVQQGDRIIVRIMTDEDGSYYASVFNYDRGIVLGGFLLVFFILLAALGGKKGLGALAGLLLTLGCIWFILIPCLLRGVPAIPVTIAVSAVSAGSGADLLKRIFEENILRGLRLCGRRSGSGNCRGSGRNSFSYERLQYAGGGKPDPVRSG